MCTFIYKQIKTRTKHMCIHDCTKQICGKEACGMCTSMGSMLNDKTKKMMKLHTTKMVISL